jgi:hypothetical protein
MYQIGRAPENASHPDHTLAMQLTRGFWATLPFLSDNLITSYRRSRPRRQPLIPKRFAFHSDASPADTMVANWMISE